MPSSSPPNRVLRSVVVALIVAVVTAASALVVRLVPSSTGTDHTLSIPVSDAGWIDAAHPNSVQSADSPLRIGADDSQRALLRFDLGQVADGQVTTAELVLTPTGTAKGPGPGVFLVAGDWAATTLTHNRRPPIESRLNATTSTMSGAEAFSTTLDPTALTDQPSISVELRDLQPGGNLALQRSGAHGPVLNLTVKPSADPAALTRTSLTCDLAVDTADQVHSSKQVFAHYFPPYPISIDNQPAENDYYARNYLTPYGENGKHAAYGGLLRDRPLPVEPSTDPDWQLRNLEREVRQAKAAGIDGFVVDLLSTSGRNWDTSVLLMQAATNVGGFTVVPMVDATASFADQSPQAAADRLAELYRSPAAYRIGDDYLLSSFAAERQPVAWWQAVVSSLEDHHHLPVSFQAVFLNAGSANLAAFAGIADGYGSWGSRTVAEVKGSEDRAAEAHRMGKTWMQPVALQDVRPRSYLYAESGNTETFRAMFATALAGNADFVQLVTWNDYSESTQLAPSQAHGWAPLSLVSYYATWFHLDQPPPLTTDTVVVTHRIQPAAASVSHRGMSPTLGGADTPPRDTVEVLTLLTRPGDVTVTVGDQVTTYRAPAGVSARTVPLAPGSVGASVAIPGEPPLAVTSPHRVITSPQVQDLQYYGVAATR